MPTWIPSLKIQQMTIKCLETIEKYTKVPHRIIWIDDGSKAEHRKFVEIWMQQKGYPYRILEKNSGFSTAANQGIALSDSKYFVLISNDVFVTDWWLFKLIETIDVKSEIGIISPVTTSAGKWQPYKKLIEKFNFQLGEHQTAEQFFNNRPKSLFYVEDWLAFFCVVIRKETWNQVGQFCEKFYMGGEDVDYSERAILAGWKLAICLHCFVYHKHWTTRKHILHYELYEKNNTELLRQKRLERSKQ